MTLHELLTVHHEALIERCQGMVAERCIAEPRPTETNGVAVFLRQLADTLKREQLSPLRDNGARPGTAPTAIGQAAARHGVRLLEHGYLVDQLVHEYGDVCQSITGLALELDTSITTDEFRTLNRCLDNAIAGAVAAYGSHSMSRIADSESELASRLHVLASDLQRLTAIALQAHAAIVSGKVGITGATGALLGHSLDELRQLAQQAVPAGLDVELAAGV